MPNTLQEYDILIKQGFETRYQHDKLIKNLTAKHLDEPKKDRKSDWDNLAVDSGIEKEDLKLEYNKYKRERDTEAMDEDERERILDNRRIIHHALSKGQMGDLFTSEIADNFVPKRLQQDAEMQNDAVAEEEKAAA